MINVNEEEINMLMHWNKMYIIKKNVNTIYSSFLFVLSACMRTHTYTEEDAS